MKAEIMNVLLVDDEADIRISIEDFLVSSGHEVVSVSSGAEALECLKARRDIGIVFSDIRMPEMDGIELLRHIQTSFPDLPVVLMTGYGNEDTATAALQNRAWDYLKKPVKLKEILAHVERIEDQRKMEGQLLQEYQLVLDGKEDGVAALRRDVLDMRGCVEARLAQCEKALRAQEAGAAPREESPGETRVQARELILFMREVAAQLGRIARRMDEIEQ